MPGIWKLVGLALLVLVACGSSPSVESTDVSIESIEASPVGVEQDFEATDEIESLRRQIALLELQVAALVGFVTNLESDLSELQKSFLCHHELPTC